MRPPVPAQAQIRVQMEAVDESPQGVVVGEPEGQATSHIVDEL